VLAAIGICVANAGWHVDGWLFSNTEDVVLREEIARNDSWPWENPLEPPMLDQLTSLDAWRELSPLRLAWRQISAPFTALFGPKITFTQFVYLLAGSLWTLAVWAVFGGAITRTAAVSFAQQENVSWRQLIRFVLARWPAYFAAPLFPILGTFVLAIVPALVGL